MTTIEQMDKIVRDALEDMLAMNDSSAINIRADAATAALQALIIDVSEQGHLIASKNKIADAQFDIAVNQRATALAQLLALTQNLTAAADLMNEAAGDTILHKVATVGNAAANTVTSIAATVTALGAALKKVGDNTSELDGAALSTQINDTLDKLKSLKNL